MEVTLSEEESSALQQALRSYLSDLRMEIRDTDNAHYREGLRHERAALESAMAKLDAAGKSSPRKRDDGKAVVELVSVVWHTEETPG